MQPLLTKSAPTFVNIYGELPVKQKEVGTQADMFLAVSLPKQSPVPDTSTSFCDEETMYV